MKIKNGEENLFENMAAKIKKKAFPGCQNVLLEKRLYHLYHRVLELIPENRQNTAIKEIIDFEKKHADYTLWDLNRYQNVNERVLLYDFSEISMFLAIQAAKSKKASDLAKGFNVVYHELISTEQTNTVIKESDYYHIVSETILDFNYASGNFDIMSLRLHHYLH